MTKPEFSLITTLDDESINKQKQYIDKVLLNLHNEQIFLPSLKKYVTVQDLVETLEKPVKEFLSSEEKMIHYTEGKRELILWMKKMPSRMQEAKEVINSIFSRMLVLLEQKDNNFKIEAEEIIEENKNLKKELAQFKNILENLQNVIGIKKIQNNNITIKKEPEGEIEERKFE